MNERIVQFVKIKSVFLTNTLTLTVFVRNIVVMNITGFQDFRAKNKIKRKENMSEIKNNTKKTEIMEEVSTIDLDKIYSLLLDPEVPAYFIQHKTGISRSVISKLRQGNRKIENLRLGSVVKVQKWLNDSNFYKDK